MESFLTKKQGFSLIWVSVAVAVFGIVLAASLPGGDLGSDSQKDALTLQRMQKVEDATTAFMAANHRRPCPADAALPMTDQNFGMEAYSMPAPGAPAITGDVTAGSNIISNVSPANGLAIGLTVSGAGIPPGTILTAFPSTLTISNNATSDGTNVPLTFSGRCSAGISTPPVSNLVPPTATATAGTASVHVGFTGIQGILIGSPVFGVGIAPGTHVVAIPDASTIKLDVPVTQNLSNSGVVVNSIVAGLVPTKSLGLPEEYAFDAYGHAFTYVIDNNATNAQTCHDMQSTGSAGGISVLPSAPIPLPGSTLSGSANMGVWNTSDIAVGYSVSGPGIAPGTTVKAIDDASNITLSQPATSSSAVFSSYTFIPPATDRVMWALLSYGKDAHGAFSGQCNSTQINNGNINVDTLNNAFSGIFSANGFSGMLVKHEPTATGLAGTVSTYGSCPSGIATCDFTNVVWYRESTKNTCCLGRDCQFATSAALDSSNYIVNGVAAGDFNGDGILDLAVTVTDGAASQRTYVFFGKKRGWFMPPDYLDARVLDGTNGFVITHSSSQGFMAQSIAAGDVNGDGYDDLVIPYNTGSYAVVFGGASVGAGGSIAMTDAWLNGTNGSKLTTGASGNNTQTVAVGDVNGDGVKDIVYSNSSAKSYVVLGSSAMPWGATTAATTTVSNSAAGGLSGYGLAVGDVNGDGKDDITLQGGGGATGTAYILFGRGSWTTNGSWQGGDASSVNISSELASGSSAISLTGNVYDAGSAANATIADLNGDGIKDLIIPSMAGTTIYWGKSGSGWSPTGTVNNPHITSAGPWPVQVADINGDGLGDIIVGGSTVNVYFQPSPATGSGIIGFANASTWSLNGTDGFTITNNANSPPYNSPIYYPVAADINADAREDIAVAATNSSFNGSPVRIYGVYGRYNVPWESTVDLSIMP